MEPDSLSPTKRSLADLLFVLFLRLAAVICLMFGVEYWAMLTGYSLGGRARFDLLALPWRVAATALSVMFPVAALGLWLTVSWGPVIWLFAAGAQVAMYTVWPEIFGQNMLVVFLHALTAIVYAVFRIVTVLKRRRLQQA